MVCCVNVENREHGRAVGLHREWQKVLRLEQLSTVLLQNCVICNLQEGDITMRLLWLMKVCVVLVGQH